MKNAALKLSIMHVFLFHREMLLLCEEMFWWHSLVPCRRCHGSVERLFCYIPHRSCAALANLLLSTFVPEMHSIAACAESKWLLTWHGIQSLDCLDEFVRIFSASRLISPVDKKVCQHSL